MHEKGSCEHQKQHKFWTKLLTTAADLVRDPIEQQKLHRKVGDILFHLGNLSAGMNDRVFMKTCWNLRNCNGEYTFKEGVLPSRSKGLKQAT